MRYGSEWAPNIPANQPTPLLVQAWRSQVWRTPIRCLSIGCRIGRLADEPNQSKGVGLVDDKREHFRDQFFPVPEFSSIVLRKLLGLAGVRIVRNYH